MKRLAIIAILSLSACSDEEAAHRILEQKGFVDIEILGQGFAGCELAEITRTAFIAIAPDGSRVNGTVCGDGKIKTFDFF